MRDKAALQAEFSIAWAREQQCRQLERRRAVGAVRALMEQHAATLCGHVAAACPSSPRRNSVMCLMRHPVARRHLEGVIRLEADQLLHSEGVYCRRLVGRQHKHIAWRHMSVIIGDS